MSCCQVTREEVSKHCTKDDLWLIIDDRVSGPLMFLDVRRRHRADACPFNDRDGVQVYDVTSWVENHPGGFLPLVNMAGKDATDNFTGYHPAYVYEKLPYFMVARLADADAVTTPFVQEYRALRTRFLEMSESPLALVRLRAAAIRVHRVCVVRQTCTRRT